MASFFNFGQTADIELDLDDAEKRKIVQVRSGDDSTTTSTLPQAKHVSYLYYDGETISGNVCIRLRKAGQKLEHQGIRIDFIGHIEVYYDRGNHNEFISLNRQLAQAGEIVRNTNFRFEFLQVEKPYESYTGANVKLRYFLRVTVARRLTDIVREFDIIVHTLSTYPDAGTSIRMEVGIEDCLHIEFEYNKSRYHLKDVIVGKIYFLLVRIKIKYMEIAIIKRESVGPGPNMYNDNENIAKYEIMDGAPVRSESIPIRLFLAGYDLSPTMKDVGKKFSVRYYLNLVLVDEEERRYFKQQEIILWRKADKIPRRPLQHHAMASYKSPIDAPTSNKDPRVLFGGGAIVAGGGGATEEEGEQPPAEPTPPDHPPAMIAEGPSTPPPLAVGQSETSTPPGGNKSDQSETIPVVKAASQSEANESDDQERNGHLK